jgi:hypothetical protein
VSGLVAVAGVLMIVANQPLIMRVLMHPPASEASTLLLVMLKELGGVMLIISALLFLAARDPARNVAILDGLIVGLCVLSVTAMLSARMLSGFYPAYMIWGKALVRLALAALLFYVRPRSAAMPQ